MSDAHYQHISNNFLMNEERVESALEELPWPCKEVTSMMVSTGSARTLLELKAIGLFMGTLEAKREKNLIHVSVLWNLYECTHSRTLPQLFSYAVAEQQLDEKPMRTFDFNSTCKNLHVIVGAELYVAHLTAPAMIRAHHWERGFCVWKRPF